MSKRVFIGVGHGGKDPGAVSAGMKESEVNLQMALGMKEELERHSITVGISRTIEENDPLIDEINECNAFNPDLAVEVHNNAGGGDGFEVYKQTNQFGAHSDRLAKCIEKRVKALGQRSRGIHIKKNNQGLDYFGWLRQVKAPAVLCEGFFLDNPADRKDFDTSDKQREMGRAYAHGVLDYLGIAVKQENQLMYTVQVGAFFSEASAKAYAQKLKSMGVDAFITAKR